MEGEPHGCAIMAVDGRPENERCWCRWWLPISGGAGKHQGLHASLESDSKDIESNGMARSTFTTLGPLEYFAGSPQRPHPERQVEIQGPFAGVSKNCGLGPSLTTLRVVGA